MKLVVKLIALAALCAVAYAYNKPPIDPVCPPGFYECSPPPKFMCCRG